MTRVAATTRERLADWNVTASTHERGPSRHCPHCSYVNPTVVGAVHARCLNCDGPFVVENAEVAK